jgi:hypothetical protein
LLLGAVRSKRASFGFHAQKSLDSVLSSLKATLDLLEISFCLPARLLEQVEMC